MVTPVLKQTRPEPVEAVQFTGGAQNASEIVDWVRANNGVASWWASYLFTANPDGTGQQGMSESLVVGETGKQKSAAVGDWIVLDNRSRFTVVSDANFQDNYETSL